MCSGTRWTSCLKKLSPLVLITSSLSQSVGHRCSFQAWIIHKIMVAFQLWHLKHLERCFEWDVSSGKKWILVCPPTKCSLQQKSRVVLSEFITWREVKAEVQNFQIDVHLEFTLCCGDWWGQLSKLTAWCLICCWQRHLLRCESIVVLIHARSHSLTKLTLSYKWSSIKIYCKIM